MAQTGLWVTLEMEPMFDAGQELVHIFMALGHRHGEQFRALERDIEAYDFAPEDVGQAELEPGRFVLLPPIGMRDLIRRARELGV